MAMWGFFYIFQSLVFKEKFFMQLENLWTFTLTVFLKNIKKVNVK